MARHVDVNQETGHPLTVDLPVPDNIKNATKKFTELNPTGDSIRLSVEMLNSIYTQYKYIRDKNPDKKDIFVQAESRGGNILVAWFTKLTDGTEVVDLVYNPDKQ